jgi:hypothetical protein
MRRLETSRDFTAKSQGHIHIYEYKLGDSLARSLGGFMCERWCFHRGLSARFTRHRTDLDILPLLRGLSAKSPYLLPCVQHAGTGAPAGSGHRWRRRLGRRGPQLGGEKGKGARGGLKGGLTGGGA